MKVDHLCPTFRSIMVTETHKKFKQKVPFRKFFFFRPYETDLEIYIFITDLAPCHEFITQLMCLTQDSNQNSNVFGRFPCTTFKTKKNLPKPLVLASEGQRQIVVNILDCLKYIFSNRLHASCTEPFKS